MRNFSKSVVTVPFLSVNIKHRTELPCGAPAFYALRVFIDIMLLCGNVFAHKESNWILNHR